MSGLVTDWRVLVALPVGSVVLVKDKRHRDVWPWVMTDDTDLVDECGDRVSTAWACVAYTADRQSPELLIESAAVRIIWRGDQDIEQPPTPDGAA